MTLEKPRWMYRFDNYRRAFILLQEILGAMQERPFNQFEKEGAIQRFEYTWDLAWKVLKDYMESKGLVLENITPANVIKEAYAANIIDKGDVWMKALDARNKMSHTYDFKVFEQTLADIRDQFYPLFDGLYEMLLEKAVETLPNG